MNGSDPRESSGVFLPTLGADDTTVDNLESAESGGLMGVGADLPTGTSSKARVSTGSLILLLVVIVAGGVLYIMRQFGLGTRLELVDVKIDYPIDDAKRNNTAHEKVLAELRDSAVAVQVPLNDVKKNPFELGLRKEEPLPRKIAEPIDREAYEREQRQRLIQTTFKSLELNSVLAGSTPIARISGENVRVGDKVRNLFIVHAIHGRSVELIADGEKYTLSMGK